MLGELAETTALGAAYLAGVGAGLWTVDDVRGGRGRLAAHARRRYEPRMGEDERAELLGGLGRCAGARERGTVPSGAGVTLRAAGGTAQ